METVPGHDFIGRGAIDRSRAAGIRRRYGTRDVLAESFLFHAQFSRRGKREAARYNPRELEHETKAFAYFEILARKRALFYLISRESIIRVLIAKLSPKQEDNFCIIVARTTARSFEGLNCEYRCSRRTRAKCIVSKVVNVLKLIDSEIIIICIADRM